MQDSKTCRQTGRSFMEEVELNGVARTERGRIARCKESAEARKSAQCLLHQADGKKPQFGRQKPQLPDKSIARGPLFLA